MNRYLLAITVLITAGCQSYYQDRIHGNENSPYFSVPVESTFVLEKEITIPTRSDRIFFQGGELLPTREVNRYQSFCFLQMDTWKERPQQVAPGSFTIRRVYDELRFQLAAHGVRLAQLDRSGSDFQVLARVHELASDSQPDVRDLVCAAWGLPQDMQRVTIKMMRDLLQGYAELQLASGAGKAGSMGSNPGPTRRGY